MAAKRCVLNADLDFGVYVVNLFDTFQASHVLEIARHSFAFLLELYCSINADKKYQLADWRARYGFLMFMKGQCPRK